jgi:tyrosyl-tRNA synthetase
MPLMEGTDGVAKMSKSVPEHAIGITDPPDEMYGKLLSVPDELVPKYASLLMDDSIPGGLSPRDAKHYIAHSITAMYFDVPRADAAKERFEKVFVRHEVPEDAAVAVIPKALVKDGRAWAVALLMEAGLAPSKGEAKRLLDQGAVEMDGVRVEGSARDIPVRDGSVLRVGKRRFARLKLSGD